MPGEHRLPRRSVRQLSRRARIRRYEAPDHHVQSLRRGAHRFQELRGHAGTGHERHSNGKRPLHHEHPARPRRSCPRTDSSRSSARKAASKFRCRSSSRRFAGPRGMLAGFLCVASDLRAVKRFQGKLLEAERLSALSEIAIGLNHAINNPLCAILGNTQLLLMERDKHDPGTVTEAQKHRAGDLPHPEDCGAPAHDHAGGVAGLRRGKRMLDVEGSEHLDLRRRPRRRRTPAGKGGPAARRSNKSLTNRIFRSRFLPVGR